LHRIEDFLTRRSVVFPSPSAFAATFLLVVNLARILLVFGRRRVIAVGGGLNEDDRVE
jgi:hypothetical protein